MLIDDPCGTTRRPELTGNEILYLAVAQVLLGYHGERRRIRQVHGDPQRRAMLPYLPKQSGYHQRLKNRCYAGQS
nr:hypothetical protein [Amycolatopsis jejuensis]